MQNPLLQKATVVDRSAAAVAAEQPSSLNEPGSGSGIGNLSTHSGPQSTAMDSTAQPRRKRVPFEKGYSQMDWVRLTQSGADLTGLGQKKMRSSVSLAEVQTHCTEDDGWTVLRGKVYNISPYLKFHPGGLPILRKALGKDCTALFDRYHAWVNAEFLLARCLIGTLAPAETPGKQP